MGQKTNPIGNRLGIIRGWESNWYGGQNFGNKLAEDSSDTGKDVIKKEIEHKRIIKKDKQQFKISLLFILLTSNILYLLGSVLNLAVPSSLSNLILSSVHLCFFNEVYFVPLCTSSQ